MKIKLVNLYKGSLICLVIIAINFFGFKFMWGTQDGGTKAVMGGSLHEDRLESIGKQMEPDVKKEDKTNYTERFFRPYQQKVLDRKYTFNKNGQDLPEKFNLPGDVVRAYFDIVGDASNMGDKKGGCGSIGFGDAPYPHAYNMLAESLKSRMPFEQFMKSFEGIGHINLLKFIEAPAVKIEDAVCPRYFVELETIEGTYEDGKTGFSYYYGFVTTVQDGDKGWKINMIAIYPEDFLCHAYHGWWHDGPSVVNVIYKDKCQIIEKVLNVEEDGHLRNVMTKGKDGKQYRFVFVRISNGADVGLRIYVLENGKWKDIVIDISKYFKEQ